MYFKKIIDKYGTFFCPPHPFNGILLSKCNVPSVLKE